MASAPALGTLAGFQALDAPARATGTSVVVAGSAYGGLMLIGGMLYGWLFQRAANDPRGGWLFGMAFGFVLWMLGPVPLLQWLPGQPILRGYPAAGLLLARLLWGLVMGLVFPWVHRSLHGNLESQPRPGSHGTGPEAAARTQMLRQLPSSKRSTS